MTNTITSLALAGCSAAAIATAGYLYTLKGSSNTPPQKRAENIPRGASAMRDEPNSNNNELLTLEEGLTLMPSDIKREILEHLLPELPIKDVISMSVYAMSRNESKWANKAINQFLNKIPTLPNINRETLKQFQDYLKFIKHIEAHRKNIFNVINNIQSQRGEPIREWKMLMGIIPYLATVYPACMVKASFIPLLGNNESWNLEYSLKNKIKAENTQRALDHQPGIELNQLQLLLVEPQWQPLFMTQTQTGIQYLVGYSTNSEEGKMNTLIQPEIEAGTYLNLLKQHITYINSIQHFWSPITSTIARFPERSLNDMKNNP